MNAKNPFTNFKNKFSYDISSTRDTSKRDSAFSELEDEVSISSILNEIKSKKLELDQIDLTKYQIDFKKLLILIAECNFNKISIDFLRSIILQQHFFKESSHICHDLSKVFDHYASLKGKVFI